MLILPAIDLRGGRCVRLRQGDYAQETVFDDDPVVAARRWVQQGATWLHIVDLDGAKVGKPVNGDSIRRIVKAAGVPCQLGGGLRTEEDIKTALAWGIERIVIGTRALKEPEWCREVCEKWPGRLALGIDAKNGMVATEGWREVSDMPALDFARECDGWPLAAVVYTDISRDGMMQGANIEAMGDMAASLAVPVIASGGVTTLEDVRRLAECGLAGCIIGRALYEGLIDLQQALKIAASNLSPGATNE
ncbi:MAG TPA: 1-(5-phosphoribosyl)-5-[(5-phosphoribosylamino)methylideneamino]imidazole-4-carboxamide isomerase [Gemmataceae bacterium]|nr:1-(5-phosphoribosyl)-5-[(5-phosphoribosylamino)methylideneamino]imidazole-4-carboxamide isomerase [Gemmataceae bacterium]